MWELVGSFCLWVLVVWNPRICEKWTMSTQSLSGEWTHQGFHHSPSPHHKLGFWVFVFPCKLIFGFSFWSPHFLNYKMNPLHHHHHRPPMILMFIFRFTLSGYPKAVVQQNRDPKFSYLFLCLQSGHWQWFLWACHCYRGKPYIVLSMGI